MVRKPHIAEYILGVATLLLAALSVFTFLKAVGQTNDELIQPDTRTTAISRSLAQSISVILLLVTGFFRTRSTMTAMFVGGLIMILQEVVNSSLVRTESLWSRAGWIAILFVFCMSPLILLTAEGEILVRKRDVLVQKGINFWDGAWARAKDEGGGSLQDLQRVASKFLPRGKARQYQRMSSGQAKADSNVSPFHPFGAMTQVQKTAAEAAA